MHAKGIIELYKVTSDEDEFEKDSRAVLNFQRPYNG